MNKTTWIDELEDLNACNDAVQWAQSYDSLDVAWAACERADWMLWLLGRLSGPPESEARKPLVLCACACARTALRFVKEGETRPLACIETVERWARGEASIDDVRQARKAAYAAARSQSLKAMADIVREHYPVAPMLGGVL